MSFSCDSLSQLKNVGDRHGSFLLQRIVPIDELQCMLLELIHEPSGAQVMHIANDDPEKLFSLSFRTYPERSDGVAHILEHTVLCGSEKFPVQDPFFSMTRRSLNTYMNALTGSDFTCYPAASQVEKDFYNLLSVYLDAVFHPRLHPLSFRQEGHRLEFQDPENPQTPLEYKGIVFNEMKGALSSADSRIWEEVHARLFPDLTYGINSGGDPKVIPELTHEELLAFHRIYYHPSRCLFFSYGDLDLCKHLDFLEENALRDAEPLPPIEFLPPQPRKKEATRDVVFYPLPPEEETKEKTHMAFTWLTVGVHEQVDLLALAILQIVLMGTDAAPLKKALLKSGLCKQASAYLDADISEVPSYLMLKGCDPENADALEQLIYETLRNIVEEGVPENLVHSALHQVEFHRSEITGGGSPFGLTLFLRSALLKQHGVSPEAGLKIHTLFSELRKKLANPGYLPSLLKKHYIENTHFVRLVMPPDSSLGQKEVDEETARLQAICDSLSSEEKAKIVDGAKRLSEFQAEQELQDLEVLPKVTLNDVSPQSKNYALQKEEFDPLTVYSHCCFTNRIVYTSLFLDLPQVDEEDLSYSKLFVHLLPQIGCGGRGYEETLEFMQEYTGGVSAGFSLNQQAQNPESFSPSFQIQGKALYRNVSQLFQLMKDMLTSPDFSNIERIKELLTKLHSGLYSSLNHSALRYALNLSGSHESVAAYIGSHWHGLRYYWFVKELVEAFDERAEGFVSKMRELQKRFLKALNPHLVLCCDEEMLEQLRTHQYYGIGELPQSATPAWKVRCEPQAVSSQGRTIASQVAFTGLVFKTVPYVHPDAPALSVLSNLLDNKVLHKMIREKGGAYGGGSSSSPLSGTFYFYGYRDPHIAHTLKAFDQSIQSILEGHFEDQDLEEAKLEVIQDLDSPVSPGGRALIAYYWMREGRSLELRQTYRDLLLSVTREDLKRVAKQWIQPGLEKGAVVSFAGRELLEKENKVLETEKKKTLEILPI